MFGTKDYGIIEDKEMRPERRAKFQRVRLDLEKGGGKIEDYDHFKAHSDHDFEH